MSKTWLFPIVIMGSAICYAQGPNDGFVMDSEATRHLLTHADPLYPPIAKAAHVQGSVLLHVDVDIHGQITKVEAIGGPAMLKAAAVDAVKQWTYTPFEVDGKVSAVRVVVVVPFSLGIPTETEKSDQAIGQAYFPKSDECRRASALGKWDDSVKLCGEAVVIADRFPDPKSRSNEIRGAHQSLAMALFFSGKLQESLKEANEAVVLAQSSLTAKNAEYASVYFSRGMAEHALKMPAEAGRDYSVAEDSYRQSIVQLPDMTKQYGFSLGRVLAFHSILEEQLGHLETSKKLRDEALQLEPHSMDAFGRAK